jgi:hypothetical protein
MMIDDAKTNPNLSVPWMEPSASLPKLNHIDVETEDRSVCFASSEIINCHNKAAFVI